MPMALPLQSLAGLHRLYHNSGAVLKAGLVVGYN
jgi:hypothetical protein